MHRVKAAQTLLFCLAIAAAVATLWLGRGPAPGAAQGEATPPAPLPTSACPPQTLLDDGVCLPVPELPEESEPEPTGTDTPPFEP